MVSVDVKAYAKEHFDKSVRKTLTIPKPTPPSPPHETPPALYAGETVWVDRKFGGQKL